MLAGLVTIEGAQRDYGVAVADRVVDAAETARLRAAALPSTGFAPGHARAAHEQRWSEAAYAAMHERLATLPVSWRAPVKAMLFSAVREAPESESADAVIARAFAAYVAQAEEAAE